MTSRNIATNMDMLADKEGLLARSGMEFIQDMVDGKLPGPPIGDLMGFWITDCKPGEVTFHGKPEFNVFNPLRTVHGGWYGTILDSCMGCAVMTHVPRGHIYTTLEYKTNIIRTIPEGMEVVATGTLQHGGRSTGVAVGEVRGLKDGKLYASGSTTCIIMPGR